VVTAAEEAAVSEAVAEPESLAAAEKAAVSEAVAEPSHGVQHT